VVQVKDVFTATLADLLAVMEKATSGDTGIHATGGLCGMHADHKYVWSFRASAADKTAMPEVVCERSGR
jgi:hypothetical protein